MRRLKKKLIFKVIIGFNYNDIIDNNIIVMDWIDRLKVMPKNNSYGVPYLDICHHDMGPSLLRSAKFYGVLMHNNLTPKITFDKLLEKLYASFKHDNPIHMNFKILCDSLDTGHISGLIKKTILDKYINNDIGIDLLYTNVKEKIIFLRDFTLTCSDGEKVLCLKSILKTIPYFKMIIEDTQIENEMTIDIDSKLMNVIMEIVNSGQYNPIGPDNYIDTLVLMDKYLMIHYFPVMIKYETKNIYNYVDNLIKINAYDKIKTLYQIFKNVLDSPMETFEFIFRGNFWSDTKLKRDIKHLMFIITNFNMGNHMITFEGWQQHFSTNQKLKYVASSKNYELLQTIDVDPVLVIAFMAHIDFSNNIYYDILNDNVDVILGTETYKPIKQSTIVVHNYYPTLSYAKIIEIPIIVISMGDGITIKFKNKTDMPISIGARILFGDELYKIIKITKYNATTRVDVNVAQYVSSQICDDIYYTLYFDKLDYNDVELFNKQMFLVENFKHRITI